MPLTRDPINAFDPHPYLKCWFEIEERWLARRRIEIHQSGIDQCKTSVVDDLNVACDIRSGPRRVSRCTTSSSFFTSRRFKSCYNGRSVSVSVVVLH